MASTFHHTKVILISNIPKIELVSDYLTLLRGRLGLVGFTAEVSQGHTVFKTRGEVRTLQSFIDPNKASYLRGNVYSEAKGVVEDKWVEGINSADT